MKDSHIGFIVIGILVVFALVAGGLYMYHTSRFNEYSEGHKDIDAKITNNTSFPYTITHRGMRYISLPNQTTVLKVCRHDDISASAMYPDGRIVEHVHRLSNDKGVSLHITPDGFRTNLTSSQNVDLVNDTSYPVLFIQKSLKGNVSHISSLIPPKSASSGFFVGGRSVWQVAHPNDQDIPISEIRVGSQLVDRLVFDGIRIRAY